MISNTTEYEKAQEEIRILEERLQRLQKTHPIGSKGFTKAGIHKMILEFKAIGVIRNKKFMGRTVS